MIDHAQLSRDLAISLGYAPESVRVTESIVDVYRMSRNDLPFPLWYEFSYTDPTIYGPLLEWLMRDYGGFFTLDVIGPHQVWFLPQCFPGMPDRSYPTLAEAVARACIAVKGGG